MTTKINARAQAAINAINAHYAYVAGCANVRLGDVSTATHNVLCSDITGSEKQVAWATSLLSGKVHNACQDLANKLKKAAKMANNSTAKTIENLKNDIKNCKGEQEASQTCLLIDREIEKIVAIATMTSAREIIDKLK